MVTLDDLTEEVARVNLESVFLYLYDRTVHLNTFLMREGLLALDDPANVGDTELFAHVDWTRTLGTGDQLPG